MTVSAVMGLFKDPRNVIVEPPSNVLHHGHAAIRQMTSKANFLVRKGKLKNVKCNESTFPDFIREKQKRP